MEDNYIKKKIEDLGYIHEELTPEILHDIKRYFQQTAEEYKRRGIEEMVKEIEAIPAIAYGQARDFSWYNIVVSRKWLEAIVENYTGNSKSYEK